MPLRKAVPENDLSTLDTDALRPAARHALEVSRYDFDRGEPLGSCLHAELTPHFQFHENHVPEVVFAKNADTARNAKPSADSPLSGNSGRGGGW